MTIQDIPSVNPKKCAGFPFIIKKWKSSKWLESFGYMIYIFIWENYNNSLTYLYTGRTLFLTPGTQKLPHPNGTQGYPRPNGSYPRDQILLAHWYTPSLVWQTKWQAHRCWHKICCAARGHWNTQCHILSLTEHATAFWCYKYQTK